MKKVYCPVNGWDCHTGRKMVLVQSKILWRSVMISAPFGMKRMNIGLRKMTENHLPF